MVSILMSLRDKFKLILIDAIVLAIAPIFSILLRFEGTIPAKELTSVQNCIPWIVIVSIAIFYFYGMYHRIWHYARMRDLVALIGAVSLSQALIFVIIVMTGTYMPRSIPILTWILTMGGWGLAV